MVVSAHGSARAVSLAAGPLQTVVPYFRQRTRGSRDRRFNGTLRELLEWRHPLGRLPIG